MPKLTTPEGEKIDGDEVSRRFNKAMADPEPDEQVAPAPARKDPGQTAVAVPGNEGQGDADESRNARPRTRRTTTRARPKASGKGKTATKAQPVEGAYVQPMTELLEAMALAAATLPVPASAMGVRIRLQGSLIKDHSAGLALAVDSAAQHNDTIRRGVESLTMGSAGWVLPAVMVVMPFAMASAQLWRTPIDQDTVDAANRFHATTIEKLKAGQDDAAAAA